MMLEAALWSNMHVDESDGMCDRRVSVNWNWWMGVV